MSDDLAIPEFLRRDKGEESAGGGVSEFKTPFANLLPPLATGEFEALKASIEAEGVRDPVIVDEDDNILDGHHRAKIEPLAPRRVVAGLTDAGKRAFVMAANLQRRNMSPEQKHSLRERQRAIALELKREGRTQAQIATALGIARNTVSVWLDTPNVTGDNRRNDAPPDARVKLTAPAKEIVLERVEAGEPQEQVAADFGVSQQHISKVAKAERKRREREAELEQQRAAIAAGAVKTGEGPYGVIVLDPPWPYGTKYDPNGRRSANPYPEMPLEDIAADAELEVVAKAAPDCILWLWTTHKFMRHSFPLLDRWGFREVSIGTWVKSRMGTGSWLRSQSEFYIMAVRGSPKVSLTNQTTVLFGDLREHSRKPDEFYTMVESLCPDPRRYDRFAREPREGWDVGGNDTDQFVEAAE